MCRKQSEYTGRWFSPNEPVFSTLTETSSIFGERERRAVTMQHHESLPLTARMNVLIAFVQALAACMNALKQGTAIMYVVTA